MAKIWIELERQHLVFSGGGALVEETSDVAQ